MVNVTAAEDTRALLLNIRRVLEPCANVCPRHVRLVRNLLTLCSEKNLQMCIRDRVCAFAVAYVEFEKLNANACI